MICFTICLCHSHWYIDKVTVNMYHLCKKLIRLIFSIQICVAKKISIFARLLCMQSFFLLREIVKTAVKFDLIDL